jgi:hypothetical protein
MLCEEIKSDYFSTGKNSVLEVSFWLSRSLTDKTVVNGVKL